MKILRVRRGFTTNSSSSSEWVPPPPGTAAPTGQAHTGAVTSTGVAPAPGSALAGNTLIVGGVVAGLVTLYLVERLVRKATRKRVMSDAEDIDSRADVADHDE